jgi:hypothetical protein
MAADGARSLLDRDVVPLYHLTQPKPTGERVAAVLRSTSIACATLRNRATGRIAVHHARLGVFFFFASYHDAQQCNVYWRCQGAGGSGCLRWQRSQRRVAPSAAPLMHGPTLSKLVLTWVALDCPALYTTTTSSYFCATSPITLASAASLPSRTGGPAMIVALAQPVVSQPTWRVPPAYSMPCLLFGPRPATKQSLDAFSKGPWL